MKQRLSEARMAVVHTYKKLGLSSLARPEPLPNHISGQSGRRKEMTLTIYAGNEATLVRSANGRRPYLQKAWIVEFGTSRTPAQPYFRPVWKTERKYFRPVWKTERKRVKSKVRSAVRKAVKATQ